MSTSCSISLGNVGVRYHSDGYPTAVGSDLWQDLRQTGQRMPMKDYILTLLESEGEDSCCGDADWHYVLSQKPYGVTVRYRDFHVFLDLTGEEPDWSVAELLGNCWDDMLRAGIVESTTDMDTVLGRLSALAQALRVEFPDHQDVLEEVLDFLVGRGALVLVDGVAL